MPSLGGMASLFALFMIWLLISVYAIIHYPIFNYLPYYDLFGPLLIARYYSGDKVDTALCLHRWNDTYRRWGDLFVIADHA
jgi:hypothetical protein